MRAVASLVLCACAFSAGAADVPKTPTKAADSGRTTAEVSVGYVLVPFVVTDLKGKPVKDLRRKDVTLLVDGKPVVLDLFERSDQAPVSFSILLDGSGSMGLVGKMDGARAAVRDLVAQRIPGDEFGLWVFAEGEVREVVPFTTDGQRVIRAVDAVRPFGKTAFYDALAKMPDKTLLGKNGSRAIVLLTDGIDNASSLTREELASLLEGVDVPVYALGLRSPGAPVVPQPGVSAEALVNLEILGHIARLTGGRVAVAERPSELTDAIRLVEKDLRSQYLVGFTPTGRGAVVYRRLSLRLAGPVRPVRLRAGYKGTLPPFQGG